VRGDESAGNRRDGLSKTGQDLEGFKKLSRNRGIRMDAGIQKKRGQLTNWYPISKNTKGGGKSKWQFIIAAKGG